MIVYAVVDDALSPDFPLGVELEVFIRREDAVRFIEEARGDDPDVGAKLRIDERGLEVTPATATRSSMARLTQLPPVSAWRAKTIRGGGLLSAAPRMVSAACPAFRSSPP